MLRRRWLALLVVNWLIFEAGSCAGLAILERARGVRYDPNPTTLTTLQRQRLAAFVQSGHGAAMAQDAELGWVPRDECNAAGMRDDHEYTAEPQAGVLRIAAFGDSFTYGSDVRMHESWTRQLAAARPSLEVLNYGVAAYGTDQALLRYRRAGADYHPHIVLIGYMSENLARCVNVFRGFYSNLYRDTIFTKPRFRLSRGGLALIPNPLAAVADYRRLLDQESRVLKEIGREDFHYQNHYSAGPEDVSPLVRLGKMLWWRTGHRLLQEPIYTFEGSYNRQAEAYSLTLAILDAFYREVLERDALPVIVVFPDLIDLGRSRSGAPVRYTGFLEHFRARGYRFVDAREVLSPSPPRHSIGELTVAWGHLSPLGGKLVAHSILGRLEAEGLLNVASVRARVHAERSRRGW